MFAKKKVWELDEKNSAFFFYWTFVKIQLGKTSA